MLHLDFQRMVNVFVTLAGGFFCAAAGVFEVTAAEFFSKAADGFKGSDFGGFLSGRSILWRAPGWSRRRRIPLGSLFRVPLPVQKFCEMLAELTVVHGSRLAAAGTAAVIYLLAFVSLRHSACGIRRSSVGFVGWQRFRIVVIFMARKRVAAKSHHKPHRTRARDW